MQRAAIPALIFAATCAALGSLFFRSEWSRDTARLGPAPPGTLRGIAMFFLGWSLGYALVGWLSVIALGAVVVALFIWMELGGAGKKRAAWNVRQQIRDSWWAATSIAAPCIWVGYLLWTGNWRG